MADRASAAEAVEIRATTVLPAVREEVEITTEDGLTLVGELSLPASGRVEATLVTLHPLPTAGGSMDSHVLRKAAWRLPHLADIAVLRFNTRGTSSPRGASEGAFDDGGAEGADVRAAVSFAVGRGLPRRWLLGWSFGTELLLRHGSGLDVEGGIMLSPPMSRADGEDLLRWQASDKPIVALVPEHDHLLDPVSAAVAFAPLPRLDLRVVPGAKHLWVGEKYVRIVLDAIVGVVAPDRAPLPTEVPAGVAVRAPSGPDQDSPPEDAS